MACTSPIRVDGRLRLAYSHATMTAAPEQVQEWEAEFEAAARRPLKTRFRYAFIHTYKPVLDDAPYRAFDSLADYRAWCEANVPQWLGYGREV